MYIVRGTNSVDFTMRMHRREVLMIMIYERKIRTKEKGTAFLVLPRSRLCAYESSERLRLRQGKHSIINCA